MSEYIAVDGMVNHEESPSIMPADTGGTGAWTFISLIVTKGTKVAVGNKFCEIIAIAIWLYTGGTVVPPGNPLPPIPDTATLVGSSTKLKDNSLSIIRIGDQALGTADPLNKIIVDDGQTILKSG